MTVVFVCMQVSVGGAAGATRRRPAVPRPRLRQQGLREQGIRQQGLPRRRRRLRGRRPLQQHAAWQRQVVGSRAGQPAGVAGQGVRQPPVGPLQQRIGRVSVLLCIFVHCYPQSSSLLMIKHLAACKHCF